MKNKNNSGITADIRTLAKTKNISQTEALRQAVHTLHVHLQGQIDRQTAKQSNEYNWSNDFG